MIPGTHGGGFPSKQEASKDRTMRKIIRGILTRLENSKERIIIEGLMNEAEKKSGEMSALEKEMRGNAYLTLKNNFYFV